MNFKSRNKSKSATFSINWNTFSPANLITNTNYTPDTMSSSSALLYNQTSNCKTWNSSSNLHKIIPACRQICITQGFSILILWETQFLINFTFFWGTSDYQGMELDNLIEWNKEKQLLISITL